VNSALALLERPIGGAASGGKHAWLGRSVEVSSSAVCDVDQNEFARSTISTVFISGAMGGLRRYLGTPRKKFSVLASNDVVEFTEIVASMSKAQEQCRSNAELVQKTLRLVLSVRKSEGAAMDPLLSALTDAISFAASYPPSLPQPQLSASDDGEIVFQWRSLRGRALATFEGDGTLGYAMMSQGKFVPGREVGAKANRTPDELKAYIEKL
jgi:hypothetical protein